MANITDTLPMSMRYTITGLDAIQSRTRLSRFDATSSEYTSNSNNKILIPIQADGFIDTSKSYLFFQVQSLHTDSGSVACNFDGNLASIIDKLEISVSGSSGKVETLDRYNVYHLYDQVWNSGVEDISYQQAVNGGSAPALDWSSNGKELAIAGGTAASGSGANAVPAKPDTTTLAIKLKAGFLNSYFNKALPAGLPQFTLEITLAPGSQAFVYSTNGANTEYKISQARFYAPVYTILDEQAMGAYTRQIQSSPTMWIAQSVSTIINSSGTGSGKQTYQLNASYRSLNGLVSLMRPTANVIDKVKNSLTAFNLTSVGGFLYRIGGIQFPSDTIDYNNVETRTVGLNVSRAYMEASKTLAPHGHTYAKTTAVSQARFISGNDAQTTAIPIVGAGSMCVSLVRFADDRLVNLGLNTAGTSAPSILEVDFNTAPASNMDITTLCLYDCVWMMNPNGTIERRF